MRWIASPGPRRRDDGEYGASTGREARTGTRNLAPAANTAPFDEGGAHGFLSGCVPHLVVSHESRDARVSRQSISHPLVY